MITFFKNDYAKVVAALTMLTDGKFPKWMIPIWYVVLLPFGLIMELIGKISLYILLKK
jgi:hypothetical protein